MREEDATPRERARGAPAQDDDARQVARFELLRRIALVVRGEVALEALLADVARTLLGIRELEYARVTLFGAEGKGGDALDLHAGTSPIAGDAHAMPPLARLVAASGVSHVARSAGDAATAAAAPCEIATPIRLHGERWGVLYVAGIGLDHADVHALEAVASYLSVAIGNARLVASLREAALLAERNRIARDLHDNVMQVLSSMNLLAQTLTPLWHRSPAEGARRVARLTELAQTAFAEMHALLHELLPQAGRSRAGGEPSRRYGIARLERHPLPASLADLLEAMVPESIELTLDFSAYVSQHAKHEEAIYRICQEAVSNAVRHARARTLSVRALVRAGRAVVLVEDDGVGLPEPHVPGIGLQSMRERAAALRGLLRVTARRPCGTRIEVVLPRADCTDRPA